MVALKRGDGGAAGRFYDRHIASVQRVVFRLLGPKADLDDVVQEVFIYALSSIDKLREPDSVRSWLWGIAAGKVRAHVRRQWRRRWLGLLPQDELSELPVAATDPQSELLEEVYSVLDQLSADQRLALVLHRIEGLSMLEAAKVSGMSTSTFKRRYARAEALFMARAKARPALRAWLGGAS